jgi:hypothetical protein
MFVHIEIFRRHRMSARLRILEGRIKRAQFGDRGEVTWHTISCLSSLDHPTQYHDS